MDFNHQKNQKHNFHIYKNRYKDIDYHIDLLIRDTPNSYPETIRNDMINIIDYKNNCSLFLYKDNELVSFFYGEYFNKNIIFIKYFWFKNAKYSLMMISILVDYIKNLKEIRFYTSFKQSNWNRFYEVFYNKELEQHNISRIPINEEGRNNVKNFLNKYRITYNG